MEKLAYNTVLCKSLSEFFASYPGIIKPLGMWFYVRSTIIAAHIFWEGELFQNKVRVTNLSKNVISVETNFRLIITRKLSSIYCTMVGIPSRNFMEK